MDFPGEEVGVGEKDCVCALENRAVGCPFSLREFPLAFAEEGVRTPGLPQLRAAREKSSPDTLTQD